MGITNVFRSKDVNKTRASSEDPWEVVLDHLLHCCLKNVICNNNLNANVMKQSVLKKVNVKLSGGSILTFANKEIVGAKKFVSLIQEAVKLGIVQGPVDSIYMYSSGMDMLDLLEFALTRIYNWSLLHGPTGSNHVKDNNPFSSCQASTILFFLFFFA